MDSGYSCEIHPQQNLLKKWRNVAASWDIFQFFGCCHVLSHQSAELKKMLSISSVSVTQKRGDVDRFLYIFSVASIIMRRFNLTYRFLYRLGLELDS